MAVKPEDVMRVAEFRNRLVAYSNYVGANVNRYEAMPDNVTRHLGEEQSWLSQEYGRISRVIGPYGTAMMRQFGMIVSQDVVRDAIQSPTHPGYGDVAQMAIGHLDEIIGKLRAEVEDRTTPRSPDALYRLTSPIYWLGRLLAFVRWLFGTNRGRLVAAVSALVLTIIGGIASGAAQAFFQRLMTGT